jgi:hypothetical protein
MLVFEINDKFYRIFKGYMGHISTVKINNKRSEIVMSIPFANLSACLYKLDQLRERDTND